MIVGSCDTIIKEGISFSFVVWLHFSYSSSKVVFFSHLASTVVHCIEGFTFTGSSCIACGPGNFTPLGSVGSCEACPAGTVDFDGSAATPCVKCVEPGLYVAPGSTGSCSSYSCPAGTIDSDNNASTPCVGRCGLV